MRTVNFVYNDSYHRMCPKDIPKILRVGDSIVIDNNETFILHYHNNVYWLKDLCDEVVDTFNKIEHIIPTLNLQYDKVEIINNSTVEENDDMVEDYTITKEDKLLAYMLYDIVQDNNMFYFEDFEDKISIDTRIERFANFLLSLKGKTVQDLIKEYDMTYWQGLVSFDEMYKEVYLPYNVGDTLYFDNEECKLIEIGGGYGILSLEHNNVVHYQTTAMLESFLLEVKDRIGAN